MTASELLHLSALPVLLLIGTVEEAIHVAGKHTAYLDRLVHYLRRRKTLSFLICSFANFSP